MMIVVEDIESIPPRKMLSIIVHPSADPVTMPTMNIPTQFVPAVISAALPTFSNFLKLNSNPRLNSRKMMPISDHWSTLSTLVTVGNRPRWGPTRNPATIYPRISGCFSHFEIIVNNPAEIRISARSFTKFSSSDISIQISLKDTNNLLPVVHLPDHQ